MQQFVKAGRIVKDRHALRVELDDWNGPGDLVIGAQEVPKLLSGRRVEINFVQCRTPDRVFIGYSGEAWLSRSGRAVTLRIEGQTYTSPIAQVRQVAAGTRASALLSRPVSCPVIDADAVQARPIDAGLIRGGF
jgi:hypothetical protein